MNGGWPPFASLRTRNAVPVQFHRDRARGLAARVIGEDPPDRAGLLLIDGTVAPDALAFRIELAHHVIAIGIATAGLAVLDASAQPSPDLLGQILEEQGVHRALEADMQVCDIALGEGDDPHAGEGHPLEQARDIFLVARQPVHGFGQHDREATARGVLDQFLYAGAEQGGTGDRPVGVAVDDRPALFLRVKPAEAQLILDRGITLVFGRIAGVERDLHNPISLILEIASPRGLHFSIDEIPCGLTGQKPDQTDQPRVASTA
ncbi:hypothetical protein GMO_26010 [Gluconobacter morbifer G707]|uniref:Uncharacterized protein n=1 Tax=Gluconobacter morbifer G707 TaxID=1088869 RepID=G6XM83_9PROT|nr:hypothetical protein GMO_26010 [Gluconobacter morbifer G707]